jgi:hypothetical protein
MSPYIVNVIKVNTLEWLGHVVRMDGEGASKKLLDAKPG